MPACLPTFLPCHVDVAATKATKGDGWCKKGRVYRDIPVPIVDVSSAFSASRKSRKQLADASRYDKQLEGKDKNQWMSIKFINSFVGKPYSGTNDTQEQDGRGGGNWGKGGGDWEKFDEIERENDQQHRIPMSQLMGGDWAVDPVALPETDTDTAAKSKVDINYSNLVGQELCQFILMQAARRQRRGNNAQNKVPLALQKAPPAFTLPLTQWRPAVEATRAQCSNVMCYAAVQRCVRFLDEYQNNTPA